MSENIRKPILYLIPTTLGESNPYTVLPGDIKNILGQIRYFIVENVRSARRFMKKVDPSIEIDSITFFELNKHTKPSEISEFISPVIKGNDIGIISEAGCPGVADPGSEIVRIAHQKGIMVKPIVGPSSILLSLMASGLNGQNFAFNGYLPIRQPDRGKKIKQLESRIKIEGQTQIFIETPYRNNLLIEDLCKYLDESTQLCIACDITLESEYIFTQSILLWKNKLPDLNKRPAIFLIGR